tara:strand:- start:9676 stop:10812 length:1137 start_codon:yes stop_codon:yes gene_type:complete
MPNIQLRVLFDCHTFDVGWQGTTTYLAGLINALPAVVSQRAPNINLQIICAAKSQESINRFINVDFDFEPIRTGFIARNLIDIPLVSRRCGANLVVSQYVRPFFSVCPTLCVIHDVLFLDFPESFSLKYRIIRKIFFTWSAKNSNFVSTVSQYSAKQIAHHLGIRQDTILVISNAVDPAFLNRQNTSEPDNKNFRLLSVSRLERRKRHEWGIYALEALASRGITASYTIVGTGNDMYSKELHTLAEQANKKKGINVVIKSGLDFESLIQEYIATDLFLCPSIAEGFGIPVIESAAVGIPCVSSDGGALSELEGQFIGRMVSAQDREGFIDAVCDLASNIKLHHFTAQHMRRKVAETYNWEAVANAYVDVIVSLAKEKK